MPRRQLCMPKQLLSRLGHIASIVGARRHVRSWGPVTASLGWTLLGHCRRLCLAEFACPEQAASRMIDIGRDTALGNRRWPPLAPPYGGRARERLLSPTYTIPGGTTDRGHQDRPP